RRVAVGDARDVAGADRRGDRAADTATRVERVAREEARHTRRFPAAQDVLGDGEGDRRDLRAVVEHQDVPALLTLVRGRLRTVVASLQRGFAALLFREEVPAAHAETLCEGVGHAELEAAGQTTLGAHR